MTVEWIPLMGNVRSEHEGTLVYSPTYFSDGPNVGRPVVSRVRSNVTFQNGSISWVVSEASADAAIRVVVDEYQDVEAGLVGSPPPGPAYAIFASVNGQNQTLATAGTRELLEPGQRMRLNVSGSVLELYANDVRVAYATLATYQSQVQFLFHSQDRIRIDRVQILPHKPKVFVVMQFSKEYDTLYEEVITPACSDYGLEVVRADDIYSSGLIISDILQSIQEASIVIADVTPDNANVYYELGFAHGIGKPTILMCRTDRERLPFDVAGIRTLFYEDSIAGKRQIDERLRKHLDFLTKPR